MPLKETVVIGAGPAGMACAYELAKAGSKPLIFDLEMQPGGICRTIDFHGYLFDIGGHRFFTRSKEINDLWRLIMRDDLLMVKRLSRIYYKKKFFDYPLNFFDTFFKLGALESIQAVVSLLWCKYGKIGDTETFEGWVTRNFGKKLYKVFFENYTEKVWGMPCSNLSADWAMQRLRGLSLKVLMQNMISSHKAYKPKTLTDQFLYPRSGVGEFYSRFKDSIEKSGGRFCWGHKVVKLKAEGDRITAVIAEDLLSGRREEIPAGHVFSTMPLPALIGSISPHAPQDAIRAVGGLKYRAFITVNVILNVDRLFEDQWLYIQDPGIRMSRMQNFKNWSSAMVPDKGRTSIGCEYFCNEGDDLWNMRTVDLVDLAVSEMEKVGVASRDHLICGFTAKVPHAYPVYSMGFANNVKIAREYLSNFKNLTTMGRGGLFRYDNSDHALLTGIYAARNYLGEGHYDVWNVLKNGGYLES